MTMNLEWVTDGTPFKYRLTTRYEIPCTVSGAVAIGDTSYRSEFRSRTTRSLVGCAGLVEYGLDVECGAPR